MPSCAEGVNRGAGTVVKEAPRFLDSSIKTPGKSTWHSNKILICFDLYSILLCGTLVPL